MLVFATWYQILMSIRSSQIVGMERGFKIFILATRVHGDADAPHTSFLRPWNAQVGTERKAATPSLAIAWAYRRRRC